MMNRATQPGAEFVDWRSSRLNLRQAALAGVTNLGQQQRLAHNISQFVDDDATSVIKILQTTNKVSPPSDDLHQIIRGAVAFDALPPADISGSR
jgi:hypothetical protein